MLKSFGMTVPQDQLEILIDRFDLDGDGEINMQEFLSFIESEQNNFGESPVIGTAGAAAMASSLLPAPRSVSPVARRAASPSPTAPTAETRVPQTARSRSPAAVPSSSSSSSAAKTRPSSAPPRPPAARPLHATAPSHLQRHHRSVHDADPDEDFDDSSVHARARKTLASTSPATRAVPLDGEAETKRRDAQPPPGSHLDSIAGGTGHSSVKDEVDVMWMARMLQAQAEIESRLGKRYYRNA